MKNYSEQELMIMPMKVLRNLDIDNRDQENLVAKVVNRRLLVMPSSQPINRRDVPDIKTPEEESHWQEVINERTAKLKSGLMQIEAVKPLDPSSEDFDPSQVDLAPEEEPKLVKKETALQKRIREIETPVEGQPIVLNQGVPSQLIRESKTKKK